LRVVLLWGALHDHGLAFQPKGLIKRNKNWAFKRLPFLSRTPTSQKDSSSNNTGAIRPKIK
jgi:hypothetical protein